jgi:hypothetical protein
VHRSKTAWGGGGTTRGATRSDSDGTKKRQRNFVRRKTSIESEAASHLPLPASTRGRRISATMFRKPLTLTSTHKVRARVRPPRRRAVPSIDDR